MVMFTRVQVSVMNVLTLSSSIIKRNKTSNSSKVMSIDKTDSKTENGNFKADYLLNNQKESKTAEEAKAILEKYISFRQGISSGNYECVGIPYKDALKAVEHASQETSLLREENEKLRSALHGLVQYWEWSIGDPHFNEYINAKKALNPKQ
jgi:hypothetical protein